MTYEAVVSVIHHLDKSLNSEQNYQSRTVTAASASIAPRHTLSNSRGGGRGRSQQSANPGPSCRGNLRRMNPDELHAYNLKCTCNSGGMLGHWKYDHNADGPIKDGRNSIQRVVLRLPVIISATMCVPSTLMHW